MDHREKVFVWILVLAVLFIIMLFSKLPYFEKLNNEKVAFKEAKHQEILQAIKTLGL